MIEVVIQAYNGESQIKACVESALLLTNHVTVMDMNSTDKTRKVAKEAGAKVIKIPRFSYVEPVRQLAFTRSTANWIFILDDDEQITPELAKEINNVIGTTKHSYFKVPRKNIFAGKKWLKNGGWWPDHQTRLIKRSALIEWPNRIHSSPQINGSMGYLKQPFLHHFHSALENMVGKTIKFENIEAEMLKNAKRPVNLLTFFRKFFGELFRRLVKNKGFLDKTYGVIESVYQAYSKTITWLLLYEKQKRKA
jgi:glycosyltransferase involved in cell wall biosynthesis